MKKFLAWVFFVLTLLPISFYIITLIYGVLNPGKKNLSPKEMVWAGFIIFPLVITDILLLKNIIFKKKIESLETKDGMTAVERQTFMIHQLFGEEIFPTIVLRNGRV